MDHNQRYAMAGFAGSDRSGQSLIVSKVMCIVRAVLASALLLPFAGPSCVVTVEPDPGGGGGGGGGSPEVIRVRLINTSNVTLDPEIFVSPQGLLVEDLFVPTNKYVLFGVGKQGFLADNDSDEFEIPCADAVTIGTKGGRFGDDLNNPDGTGTQIVLRLHESVFCNGRLTLTYSGSGNSFQTTFVVEP
jgi:hypothetical protein